MTRRLLDCLRWQRGKGDAAFGQWRRGMIQSAREKNVGGLGDFAGAESGGVAAAGEFCGLEPDERGGAGGEGVLVSHPAQSRHAVKCFIAADHGLPVVTGKTRDPVVILAEPCAGLDQLPIHVRCRVHDAWMQRQHPSPRQPRPSGGIGGEQHRQLASGDHGKPYVFRPVRGKNSRAGPRAPARISRTSSLTKVVSAIMAGWSAARVGWQRWQARSRSLRARAGLRSSPATRHTSPPFQTLPARSGAGRAPPRSAVVRGRAP